MSQTTNLDESRESSQNLKLLRRKLGLTQVQLGAKVGVSGATVSNWEKGASDIPEKHVHKLRALGWVGTRLTGRMKPTFSPALDPYADKLLEFREWCVSTNRDFKQEVIAALDSHVVNLSNTISPD